MNIFIDMIGYKIFIPYENLDYIIKLITVHPPY